MSDRKEFFDLHKERAVKEQEDKVNALAKARDTHHQAREEAITLVSLQPDLTKWNIAQFKIMLKSLKTKEDRAMPTKKAKMLEAYLKWNDEVAAVGCAGVVELDLDVKDDDQ